MNVLGYDPYWTDEKQRRFQWRHFAEIRKAGFDFVRVNLHSFKHMDEANRLNPEWLRKLDDIVLEAQKAGLSVILDEHDFNDCANDLDLCRTKLTAFWSQVAPRYASAPNSVAFELLNEPNGRLTAQAWNALAPKVLAAVRATNPDRVVMIGPVEWNSVHELKHLRLPADRNLIVSIHSYDPFDFTHQGVAHLAVPALTVMRPASTDSSTPSGAQLHTDVIVPAVDMERTRWKRCDPRPGAPGAVNELVVTQALDARSNVNPRNVR